MKLFAALLLAMAFIVMVYTTEQVVLIGALGLLLLGLGAYALPAHFRRGRNRDEE